MNNISADATRVTAPPALHWACDSPALPLLAVVPPSRIEPFLFSVGIMSFERSVLGDFQKYFLRVFNLVFTLPKNRPNTS